MVTVACFCQFLVVKLISCFGVEPIGSAATRRALILVGIDVAARLMGNVMFRLFFFFILCSIWLKGICIQLLAMDHLAHTSMKNAAKCEM